MVFREGILYILHEQSTNLLSREESLATFQRKPPFEGFFIAAIPEGNIQESLNQLLIISNPVDTGRKLNVHKTFRRPPGRLLKVFCTFNLRPVSTGKVSKALSRLDSHM